MENQFIIDFERTKTEAEKLIFGKSYKKKMWTQLVLAILMIPGVVVLSFLSVAAFSVLLNVKPNDSTAYLITIIVSVFFIRPFIKPFWVVKKMLKNQHTDLFYNIHTLDIHYRFTDEKMFFKNTHFEFISSWNNMKNLRQNESSIVFQTRNPFIEFQIPKIYCDEAVINFLERKINHKLVMAFSFLVIHSSW